MELIELFLACGLHKFKEFVGQGDVGVGAQIEFNDVHSLEATEAHGEEVIVDIDVGTVFIVQTAEEIRSRNGWAHESGLVVEWVAFKLVDEVFVTHVTRCTNVDVAHEGERDVGGIDERRVHLMAEIARLHKIRRAEFLGLCQKQC